MIVFSLVVIGLIGAALLFVVPPLLKRRPGTEAAAREDVNAAIYRDQLRELEEDIGAGNLSPEQADEARLEISRRVLEEGRVAGTPEGAVRGAGREAAIGVIIGVPLVALLLYVALGMPKAITGAPVEPGHDVSEAQVEAMVARLAARMKTTPDDGQGWEMLARSYAALQKFEQAVEAYAHAVKLTPPDAGLFADYADALAMAQGQRLEGEPERLVMQALKLDPANLKALALAGTAAYNRKDYRGAVDYWQRMLDTGPAESEMVAGIRSSIAEARELMGQAGQKAPAAPSAKAPQSPTSAKPAGATPGATVVGTVKLSPALAAQAQPGDTVFVFARAANGPRMPVAILRRQVKDLPFAYKLDDTTAMTEVKLSSLTEVVVGARVSRSGEAALRPGDLQGASAPVKVGARNVDIVIDTVADK